VESVWNFEKFCRECRLDLNPDKITPPPENPGVGISSQILVHPSHVCQIGGSDQGLIAKLGDFL